MKTMFARSETTEETKVYLQVKLFWLNTLLKIIQFFPPFKCFQVISLFLFHPSHIPCWKGHCWGQMNNEISGKEKETYNMGLTLGSIGMRIRIFPKWVLGEKMFGISVSTGCLWLDLEDRDIAETTLGHTSSLVQWENYMKPQTSFNAQGKYWYYSSMFSVFAAAQNTYSECEKKVCYEFC